VSSTMCTYSIMLAHPLCCCACHRLARTIHTQCHQQCLRTVSCKHTPCAAVHVIGWPEPYTCSVINNVYVQYHVGTPLLLLCLSCMLREGQTYSHIHTDPWGIFCVAGVNKHQYPLCCYACHAFQGWPEPVMVRTTYSYITPYRR